MVNKNNKENNLTTYIALQYYNFSDDITDCICAIKTREVWKVVCGLLGASNTLTFDHDYTKSLVWKMLHLKNIHELGLPISKSEHQPINKDFHVLIF